MTVKIVTDSTMSIEPELVKALDIHLVRLSYLMNGVIVMDGAQTMDEYLTDVSASKDLPKTSQPPIGVFTELFEELTADGSSVIAIHLAQTLSGTVEAARQAASLVHGDIHVVDSSFTDQALKFQVVKAAELAADGADVDTILTAVEAVKRNTELFCGVSTMENLIKGGRVGRVTGLISTLLDMHLILQMKDSELLSIAKAKGAKTFKKWLGETTERLAAQGRKIKEIGVSHADGLDLAKMIADTLQPFVEKTISILDTSTVIATHTGRGAWAVEIQYD